MVKLGRANYFDSDQFYNTQTTKDEEKNVYDLSSFLDSDISCSSGLKSVAEEYESWTCNRFSHEITDIYWQSSGEKPDAIIFSPLKDIILVGFSLFTAVTQEEYYLLYVLKLDGVEQESELLKAKWEKGNIYFRLRLSK